eukprot:CAMPEP_0180727556 /NCGR_PEP_ID=MMETSP1038_2-20121128/19131_1 /TAXON_ID=632150 /ORGANISM="Azadinium spinosum, Strain 3D9" /LENGTH=404 /DNA_ID=CAMNT_0022760221 /DNA_START=523 /DNA_END=1734 /DNA_ORIENTATION=+
MNSFAKGLRTDASLMEDGGSLSDSWCSVALAGGSNGGGGPRGGRGLEDSARGSACVMEDRVPDSTPGALSSSLVAPTTVGVPGAAVAYEIWKEGPPLKEAMAPREAAAVEAALPPVLLGWAVRATLALLTGRLALSAAAVARLPLPQARAAAVWVVGAVGAVRPLSPFALPADSLTPRPRQRWLGSPKEVPSFSRAAATSEGKAPSPVGSSMRLARGLQTQASAAKANLAALDLFSMLLPMPRAERPRRGPPVTLARRRGASHLGPRLTSNAFTCELSLPMSHSVNIPPNAFEHSLLACWNNPEDLSSQSTHSVCSSMPSSCGAHTATTSGPRSCGHALAGSNLGRGSGTAISALIAAASQLSSCGHALAGSNLGRGSGTAISALIAAASQLSSCGHALAGSNL